LAAGPAASKSNPWQAGGMSAEEQELQKKVREIALTLRAPCCPELTLAQHDSPQTLAIKREIRDMLKEGKGRGEIVSTLRARYGNAITGGIVASSWRPILIIGGSVLGLVVILLVARWMMFHEKEPMHLDEGHWMEEQAEKGPGGESFKKAS
jgi:cytochrome c-type biogenesis protein CcmH/NrfF